MCIAVPGRIISIDDMDMATVEFGGTSREASIDLVPDVVLGDYVLVHAGFIINKLDEEDAKKTLELFREYMRITEEGG
jgi:hydrogenase expression/formation protein HypC